MLTDKCIIALDQLAFKYIDGVKKFDSGTMTAKEEQKYVEVPLAGAKELKLVVTDGGNGQGSDHATWGAAKLH